MTKNTALPATMVFRPTATQELEPQKDKPSKESPEDASMKDGRFKEYNTEAPSSTSVKELFSLKGKTAIVSGSGAGIGLAVVQGFAEAGANVAIWYHGNKKALERAKEVEERWGVKCM